MFRGAGGQIRRVAKRDEILSLLDINQKWVIRQRWNYWEEKPFNLNEEDVKEIVKDILDRRYTLDAQRPWMELYDDGHVKIQYPNTCTLENKIN